MSINTVYKIYEIDSKGMLEEPEDGYNNNIYLDYNSEDEAIRAIDEKSSFRDYIILKQVSKQFEFKED